ncbi:MarR family winged helix-turn-helix transcriptional regulator [Vibrio panuliri]|uniref:Transcriptional regulator n=1 Tax=Vibrio panuliri TaxID=1381081 RepID=A0A1Q9HRU8_9VIBR|nr:MarR family transcriptional regulator [Vibrio panuliri]KAB1457168.1 MarR family transcriptional regulator [Vibrio panuliri]OLQ93576.1 transcriptional regulator [Vibrio panuliri]OLQ96226.1 transcriptional regulator [Vibrio panuliri]
MDTIDRALGQWQNVQPSLNTQPLAIIGRVLRIAKHLENEMASLHKSFGLKPGEFDVLVSLYRSDAPQGLTPSELINAMILTSGAMTNRLDKLEAKHLIQRTHNETDRRSVKVKLTPQGKRLINDILPQHSELQESLIANIEPKMRKNVEQMLAEWMGQFE